MENTKKMIVCATCAGEYEASLVRCPFCGTAYAPAEEEEYMGQMDGIRKELEGHKQDGNKTLKKGLGTTMRIVLLLIAVILLLVLGGLWFSGNRERNRSDRRKEEFLLNQGISTQQEESAQ